MEENSKYLDVLLSTLKGPASGDRDKMPVVEDVPLAVALESILLSSSPPDMKTC